MTKPNIEALYDNVLALALTLSGGDPETMSSKDSDRLAAGVALANAFFDLDAALQRRKAELPSAWLEENK